MRGGLKTFATGLALVLMAAAVLTARPGLPMLYPPRAGEPTVAIFLVDNGFHTDVALPGPELARTGGPTAQAARQLSRRQWVLAGWGDESFYTGTGLSAARVADGLRALFAPGNPSVVHLYGVSRRPDQAFAEGATSRVVLSRAGFERMVGRIDRSFALKGGAPVRLPVERGLEEAFFHGVETFSLLRLCNHWTAEVLNAAGLAVTPVLATVPFGLRLDLSVRARLAGRSLDSVPPAA